MEFTYDPSALYRSMPTVVLEVEAARCTRALEQPLDTLRRPRETVPWLRWNEAATSYNRLAVKQAAIRAELDRRQ